MLDRLEQLVQRAKAYLEWKEIPAPKYNHVEPLKDIFRDLAEFDTEPLLAVARAAESIESWLENTPHVIPQSVVKPFREALAKLKEQDNASL